LLTVTFTTAEVAVLFAPSYAFEVSVCDQLDAVVVFQPIECGEVVIVPISVVVSR
jgi:hypothetical protein